MRRHLLLAALLTCVAPMLVRAQNPAIQVENPWARATSPSAKVGGAFLTLRNTGADDRLLEVSSPIAATVELHRTVNENGVMKMLPVDAVPVAAGQAVDLKPGNLHIMLIDLRRQLKQGDTFPLTLRFEKAPPVTATVVVGAPGAAGPDMSGHMQGHMQGTTSKP